MSQTLARVLAQVCSKKLSMLYSAAEQMQSEQQNQGTSSSTRTSSSSVPSPVPSITSERYIYCACSPLYCSCWSSLHVHVQKLVLIYMHCTAESHCLECCYLELTVVDPLASQENNYLIFLQLFEIMEYIIIVKSE